MDEQNPIEFPPDVRAVLDAAVLALWDTASPVPDLSPLSDWLEVDGWDYVVNGMVGPYCYLGQLVDYLNDDYLLECTDIENYSLIKNPHRIEFARREISTRLNESMDGIHRLTVHSANMPPVDLCMMVYFHPQGGADFSNVEIHHSIDDYLKSFKGEIILDADSLSDREILRLWKKG